MGHSGGCHGQESVGRLGHETERHRSDWRSWALEASRDRAFGPALSATPNARLWSVLSRDRDRASQFAQAHGAGSPTPAHTDLAELLADPDLDGVIIASPDRVHAEQAVLSARSGKHILCEKPLATSVEDAPAHD